MEIIDKLVALARELQLNQKIRLSKNVNIYPMQIGEVFDQLRIADRQLQERAEWRFREIYAE